MDGIEASDWRSRVPECPFLNYGDTPTISDVETRRMKPIQMLLPKDPWIESPGILCPSCGIQAASAFQSMFRTRFSDLVIRADGKKGRQPASRRATFGPAYGGVERPDGATNFVAPRSARPLVL